MMTKRIAAALLVLGTASTVVPAPALADPEPPGNGHNCAGLASTFLPPGFGQEVKDIAKAFPTAVPTSLDFANCGGNGFPPKPRS
jgi:hypothetical protein